MEIFSEFYLILSERHDLLHARHCFHVPSRAMYPGWATCLRADASGPSKSINVAHL